MPSHRNCLRIAAAICVAGVLATASPSRASSAAASEVVVDVVDLTNVERRRYERAPLRANARLMRAAQLHADQMARARQLAHVLPKAAFPRAEDRIAAAEYRWQTYGENVALGQSDAAAVLKDWMRSRGHRTNILNPNFTEMGAGYATDREGRPYYVQVFAAPVS
jgi:uncharacterized protein YkwD